MRQGQPRTEAPCCALACASRRRGFHRLRYSGCAGISHGASCHTRQDRKLYGTSRASRRVQARHGGSRCAQRRTSGQRVPGQFGVWSMYHTYPRYIGRVSVPGTGDLEHGCFRRGPPDFAWSDRGCHRTRHSGRWLAKRTDARAGVSPRRGRAPYEFLRAPAVAHRSGSRRPCHVAEAERLPSTDEVAAYPGLLRGKGRAGPTASAAASLCLPSSGSCQSCV